MRFTDAYSTALRFVLRMCVLCSVFVIGCTHHTYRKVAVFPERDVVPVNAEDVSEEAFTMSRPQGMGFRALTNFFFAPGVRELGEERLAAKGLTHIALGDVAIVEADRAIRLRLDYTDSRTGKTRTVNLEAARGWGEISWQVAREEPLHREASMAIINRNSRLDNSPYNNDSSLLLMISQIWWLLESFAEDLAANLDPEPPAKHLAEAAQSFWEPRGQRHHYRRLSFFPHPDIRPVAREETEGHPVEEFAAHRRAPSFLQLW